MRLSSQSPPWYRSPFRSGGDAASFSFPVPGGDLRSACSTESHSLALRAAGNQHPLLTSCRTGKFTSNGTSQCVSSTLALVVFHARSGARALFGNLAAKLPSARTNFLKFMQGADTGTQSRRPVPRSSRGAATPPRTPRELSRGARNRTILNKQIFLAALKTPDLKYLREAAGRRCRFKSTTGLMCLGGSATPQNTNLGREPDMYE